MRLRLQLESHCTLYILDIIETNQKVQEAGLLTVENILDEQAGVEEVPFELDDNLDDVDDMPNLEEQLPPYVIVEKDDEDQTRAQPPPLLTAELPPENLPELPRRSVRNQPKKKTISEELNCKYFFICNTLV